MYADKKFDAYIIDPWTLTVPSLMASSSTDWPGRYYHIDQVLNTPGPRTDPEFLAGDGVRGCCFDTLNLILTPLASR